MLRLENLKNEKKVLETGIESHLAVVVKNHVEILRFAKNVETTLRELFLVEVIVSTLLMCLLEYYCMVEWETSDSAAILTYVILLFSFTFNILIFCYVGELLLGQGSEIATALYEIEWYNLPGRKARDIILLLVISKYPPKLTAGKIFILSMNTFSVVLKSSVVYLNMLRTITEL
ncbi:odorant receptor 51 isoform X1 [Apis mellifera caucasica]|nr:odorant receptor 51 isoform X1 [Apis mellifera caucasica]